MARSNSPGYPNLSLPKAISAVRKIFDADRRNPIDRATAAKHIGYGSISGASDKALASLAHYGLTERTGKGEIRVSQLGLDIVHPDPSTAGAEGSNLFRAAMNANIIKALYERFGSHVSEGALRTYLIRENFQNIAINQVINSFFETCRYLEQHKAFESGGISGESPPESPSLTSSDATFGGATVGDLIRWEVDGSPRFERPMRVRLVTDDGEWVAVDGIETGIPMSQVIVEERAPSDSLPPRFALAQPGNVEPQQVSQGAQPGQRKAMFPLDEGDVTLIFPEGLSPAALEDLSDYLDIFLKKERKKAATSEMPESGNEWRGA